MNEEPQPRPEELGADRGRRLPDGVLPLPGPDPGVEYATLLGRYRVPLNDTLAFDVDVADRTSAHDDGIFLASGDIILKTEVAGEGYGVLTPAPTTPSTPSAPPSTTSSGRSATCPSTR